MHKLLRDEISVLIPASGGWNNKKNFVQNKPIYNDKTIVDHILATLLKHRFKDIYVSTGYNKNYSTKSKFVSYLNNDNYKTSSVVHSLSLLIQAPPKNKNVLIINGDIYFDTELIKAFDFSCTQLIYHLQDAHKTHNIGISIDEGNNLQNIMWGLPNQWSQCIFIAEKDFDLFANMLIDPLKHRVFFIEIINKIANEIPIKCIPTLSNTVDIDNNKNLLLVKNLLNEV